MAGYVGVIDSGQGRFRCTKRDDALVLEGAITDATKFDMLKELGSKGVDVDLSGILCTGLTGARALWEALTEFAPDCRLVNVPYSIYIVLMNTDARAYIGHKHMRYAQVAVDGKSVIIVDGNDITGTPASLPGSAELVQLHHTLWDDKQNADDRAWLGAWSMGCPDEALFCADYVGFVSNTVIQSQQVLLSTVYAIDRYLRLIELRIKSFANAWTGSGLKDRSGSWGGISAIEAAMASASEICNKMFMFVVTSQSDYGRIMHTLMTSENPPYDVLKTFTVFRKRQETLSKAIEEAGVSLGALLFAVVTFRAIRGDVDATFKRLPKESIAKILESLDIMNPMAEDDVEEAVRDVISESENGEADVDSCIVVLQAFDLVRQILEHRAQEYTILETALPNLAKGAITWESVRDDIVKQIKKRMVTDQEKSAFERYLGYLEDPSAKKEEASAPGDVMLF